MLAIQFQTIFNIFHLFRQPAEAMFLFNSIRHLILKLYRALLPGSEI